MTITKTTTTMLQHLKAEMEGADANMEGYTHIAPDRKQEVATMKQTGDYVVVIFAFVVFYVVVCSPILGILDLASADFLVLSFGFLSGFLLRMQLELNVFFLMGVAKFGRNVHSITYGLMLLFQLMELVRPPPTFVWIAFFLAFLINLCQLITLLKIIFCGLSWTMKRHRRFHRCMKLLCSAYVLISANSLRRTLSYSSSPYHDGRREAFDQYHVSRLFFAFAAMVGSKVTSVSRINDDVVIENIDSSNNKQHRTELYLDPERERNPPCLGIFMYLFFPIMVLRALMFFGMDGPDNLEFGGVGWTVFILCATYILYAILLYPSRIQVRSDASILIETLGNRYIYHNATHAIMKSAEDNADRTVPEKKLVDFSNTPKDEVRRKVTVLVYFAKDDHILQLTPIHPDRFMEAVNLAGRQFGGSTPSGDGIQSDDAGGWSGKGSEPIV